MYMCMYIYLDESVVLLRGMQVLCWFRLSSLLLSPLGRRKKHWHRTFKQTYICIYTYIYICKKTIYLMIYTYIHKYIHVNFERWRGFILKVIIKHSQTKQKP